MKNINFLFLISILFLVIFSTNSLYANTFLSVLDGKLNSSILDKYDHHAFGLSSVVELDQKVYTWTDRVYITVISPDHNTDPNLVESINVTVSTKGKSISNYRLTETGVDTGIFTGYVILTGDSHIKGPSGVNGLGLNPTGAGPLGVGPTDGFLPSKQLDNVTASFEFAKGQTATSSALIRWNIGEIKWLKSSYPVNSEGVLEIVDPDMNLDPNTVDTFLTRVWSNSDPTGIKITMTETGIDTGVFQAHIVFINKNSFSNKLYAVEGDTVTGEYRDRTLPSPYTAADELSLTSSTYIGTQMQLPSHKSAPIFPQKIIANYQSKLPPLTPLQIQKIKDNIAKADLEEPPIPITNPNFSHALPGTNTVAGNSINHVTLYERGIKPQITFVSQKNYYQPISFGALNLKINSTIPNADNDILLEPSAAHGGSTIFYSTNWYAATSDDNGNTWTYLSVNPPSPFISDYCCDSDIIYDPHNKIFIWYQQQNHNGGTNKFRLAVSTDDTNTWNNYDVSPPNAFLPSGTWWDYPQLALTDNYLFITTHLFYANGAPYGNVILREKLSDLASSSSLNLDVVPITNVYTITPIQGAKDTMYLASHDTNNHVNIYKWEDGLSFPFISSLTINSWKPGVKGSMVCAPAGIANWCSNSDDRILNGWKYGDNVGFFWNAPQDIPNGFNWPYVNSAMFTIDPNSKNLHYSGSAPIWDSHIPWMYAYSAPTLQGLGLIAFSGMTPNASIAAEDFATSPPHWSFQNIRSSNSSPSEFGDYVRVRSFDDNDCLWLGTGYTAFQNNTGTFFIPFATVFGSNACAFSNGGGGSGGGGSGGGGSGGGGSGGGGSGGGGSGGGGSGGGGSCPAANSFGDDTYPGHKEPTPQLQTLRDFRENVILSTITGTAFMKGFNTWYFALGSYVSPYEDQNPWFKQFVKISISPILYILEYSAKTYSAIPGEFGVALFGIISSTLIGSVYLSPIALLFRQVRNNKFNYKIGTVVVLIISISTVIAVICSNYFAVMMTSSLFVSIVLGISAIFTGKLIYKVFKFSCSQK